MKDFIPLLIEAIIFLIPIVVLFMKLGRYAKVIEGVEEFPEWKSKVDTKVETLEKNDAIQNQTLVSINQNLIEISTKVSLLLDNKIKMEA